MNTIFLTLRSASPAGAVAAAAFMLLSGNAVAQRAGQADPNFGGNGNGTEILTHEKIYMRSAAVAPGGDMYAVGNVFAPSPSSQPAMLRIGIDGYLDAELGVVTYDIPNGYTSGSFKDIQILDDGSLIAAGHLSAEQSTIGVVCKIAPSGKVDSSFANGSIMSGCLLVDALSDVASISVRSDAGLVISGGVAIGSDDSETAIAHASKAGVIDDEFANGSGVARMPAGYVADSYPLKTILSPDNAITTLVNVEGALFLVRHESDGVLDQKFSADGAILASQFAAPLGIALGENESIFLAVISNGEYVRDLTLMKFQADGSPAAQFTGPASPPGQSRIKVCDGSCTPVTPTFPNNLLRSNGGQLVLGAAAHYADIDATRPIAVRVNETTGLPDPKFGDTEEGALIGVGRGIALPANLSAFSSVLRGDRLTIVGNLYDGGFRVVATGFLGDRLMADGFE